MRNFKRTVLFLLVGVFVFATFSLNSNAAGKWSIVRGYGSCVGTGEGLEESADNITYFNGYGGTCYVANTFHEAVAVEFQLIQLQLQQEKTRRQLILLHGLTMLWRQM